MQSSSQDENVVADEQQWVGADASQRKLAAWQEQPLFKTLAGGAGGVACL